MWFTFLPKYLFIFNITLYSFVIYVRPYIVAPVRVQSKRVPAGRLCVASCCCSVSWWLCRYVMLCFAIILRGCLCLTTKEVNSIYICICRQGNCHHMRDPFKKSQSAGAIGRFNILKTRRYRWVEVFRPY